jgi:hypothetical protein
MMEFGGGQKLVVDDPGFLTTTNTAAFFFGSYSWTISNPASLRLCTNCTCVKTLTSGMSLRKQ